LPTSTCPALRSDSVIRISTVPKRRANLFALEESARLNVGEDVRVVELRCDLDVDRSGGCNASRAPRHVTQGAFAAKALRLEHLAWHPAERWPVDETKVRIDDALPNGDPVGELGPPAMERVPGRGLRDVAAMRANERDVVLKGTPRS
jgi:hypothetical protein